MLLKYWFTPKFPLIHYSDNVGFLKKWFFNPLKRWAARIYLSLLRKFTEIKVIGITGSAGKTTSKEMLASVLREEGKTVFSKANIDPVYNIPNTILRTLPGTKFLILEMGVEYPDEMDFYLWLAKPDVGVITNIYPTHLEFFKNEEGVLKEKRKLVTMLPKSSTAVLNSDIAYLKKLGEKLECNVSWFNASNDPLKTNLECVAKVAEALGVGTKSIARGLTNVKLPEHRFNWIKLSSGGLILDDSYNSNPAAVTAITDVFLKERGNRKIAAVLGDMLELGNYEKEAHQKIGKLIADKKFDVFIGVGPAMLEAVTVAKKQNKKIKALHLPSVAGLKIALEPYLNKNYAVLVKGSHSIGLYKFIEELS
jgi:UDP-N-acetylmuramoyl-tripeptide--D-alanyl-D-alanine ligase